ncbi:isoaspartyl peptidase/L-asparaginase [bacterium BD-1]|nr:isoaspartyl peptidase/L-asparaginase [Ottowia caeni]
MAGSRHWLWTLGLALLAPVAWAADYAHYQLGNPDAPTPGQVRPGLLLMGGGDRNFDSLRWFFERAGHGHIVVLRASLANEVAEEFYNDVGGIASVETYVVANREASTDPALLRSLARADGIFIAGGDQSRYVRYWRGTPVAAALQKHVMDGKPLGGTSAGLAMLGEYLYGAMDGGSQVSPLALADPLGTGNTIETDFLALPLLHGVLTDTHFRERNRLGRLVAFVAKAEAMAGEGRRIVGLGVDEDAALALEGDGTARVYATAPGAGATVVPGGFPRTQQEDLPMQLPAFEVIGADAGSLIHLPEGRVEKPAFRHRYAVRDGVLVALDQPLLVIHGGAGVERATLDAREEADARAALGQALRAGHAALMAGKPALDAVTAAITVLEDAPQFNAGRGAVFTHDGRNELDASVMDGATGQAGAVAGVHRVRSPITLARAVMEKSKHVMMVGDGAETFAAEQGIELVDPAWFRTEKRWQQLQKALAEEANAQAAVELPGKAYFGTVGALALDAQGRLAAGTSTGGMTNKRYGRVGDSPVIGAGTWADERCAFSGTGWGEYYLRAAAAYDVCARMKYSGVGVRRAAEAVINETIPAKGGDGGAIALSADGEVAFPFNTEGMYRGWIGADGVPHVAVFAGEALAEP